ncbi:hypothetical protein BDK51DRAFT_33264 [Blyttiomyces helicus]|uniref:Uncharacterized protein n=1 Tax=Blyttiomyces helicus TaxID=388810 RepID=A0A4V1IPQ7_9FUNG|nr:hypothetical protein BDK51DRAFT_33264 [Blyttiomyces helicus]|eukprot:RKO83897.1 hypothetical protein BDK51DRAFT_33264 [Blyttiomyces helicus]
MLVDNVGAFEKSQEAEESDNLRFLEVRFLATSTESKFDLKCGKKVAAAIDQCDGQDSSGSFSPNCHVIARKTIINVPFGHLIIICKMINFIQKIPNSTMPFAGQSLQISTLSSSAATLETFSFNMPCPLSFYVMERTVFSSPPPSSTETVRVILYFP